MKSVFDYTDYRLFIRDYYEYHKGINAAFSYRYMAERAGINSAPFFKFVIEGRRNLTKSSLLKACVAMRLKDREAEYFENLVFFNQARSVKEKSEFFEKLIGLQRAQNVRIIRKEQYEYFREPHHCVLRELAAMVDFGEDYGKLGRLLKPPLPAAKTRESIDLLLELGFLAKDQGRYVQTEPILSTGHGLHDYQLIRFQVRMLEMAITAFDRCMPTERHSSSTTFSLSRKSYEKLVRNLREFRSRALEAARQEAAPDRVCQLTVNLFPVGKLRQKEMA